MEQGPVLVMSFNAQQIMVVRNLSGKVVEGDPVSMLFEEVYFHDTISMIMLDKCKNRSMIRFL